MTDYICTRAVEAPTWPQSKRRAMCGTMTQPKPSGSALNLLIHPGRTRRLVATIVPQATETDPSSSMPGAPRRDDFPTCGNSTPSADPGCNLQMRRGLREAALLLRIAVASCTE